MNNHLEKSLRFTIILLLVLLVLGAYSLQSGKKKEYLVYSESLDETVLTIDGEVYTLEDIAFYVAYEEKSVQEKAIIYNPEKPNQYWNIHTNGEFVKVAAKQAVLDMAVHDELFYKQALAEGITMTEEELRYAENEMYDFCSDIEEEQYEALGVDESVLRKSMEKVAYANKYQQLLAAENNSDYEAYNFDGELYLQWLKAHEIKENEAVWDRIRFGNITLDNY